MSRTARLALLVAVALGVAACSDDSGTADETEPVPDPTEAPAEPAPESGTDVSDEYPWDAALAEADETMAAFAAQTRGSSGDIGVVEPCPFGADPLWTRMLVEVGAFICFPAADFRLALGVTDRPLPLDEFFSEGDPEAVGDARALGPGALDTHCGADRCLSRWDAGSLVVFVHGELDEGAERVESLLTSSVADVLEGLDGLDAATLVAEAA